MTGNICKLCAVLLLASGCSTLLTPDHQLGNGKVDVNPKALEAAKPALRAGVKLGAKVSQGTVYGSALNIVADVLDDKGDPVDPVTLWPGGVDILFVEYDDAGNFVRTITNEVRAVPVPRPIPGTPVIRAPARGVVTPPTAAPSGPPPKILRYDVLEGEPTAGVTL